MKENALPVDRIQSYLRDLARSQYAAVPLPPFTLFFHPSDPFPYFSYAIPEEPVRADDPALPGTLARLREIFMEQGRTPRFEFFEAFAPALPALLQANGFSEEARQWSMICTPQTYRPAPAVPGLEIVHLIPESPAEHLKGFVIAQHAGFDNEEPADENGEDIPPEEIEIQRANLRAGWTSLLARLDGVPVAAASFGNIIDGISEVAGIATRPSYRRRGIATVLAGRCAEMIFAQGGQIATLTAADEAAGRVYEKVGFRPFSTMLAYN